jgi:hypothetical protein
MNLMRRASTCVALGGAFVALLLPSLASATPTVTFKAEAVPIPGVHNVKTGNILGAGAAFKSVFKIEGNEYGGHTPPLIGVNVQLPKGTKIDTSGFPTCPTATLTVAKEPEKCPSKSKAGPVGSAKGFVVFGGEEVPETVSIESFYASGGGINFFVAGHSPAIIEITSTGKFTSLGNTPGGFGPKFNTSVPLIETVPGANDGSTELINAVIGSAYKKNGKYVFYGRVPKTCPKGGFPVKAELEFANTSVLPNVEVGQTVVAEAKAPCPRK